jgi:glycosyltransferase involved in cell wall biosynthesis
MEKIRVILISSVRPEPTSAGQIILYRHFCNRPEFDLEVYGFEPTKFSVRMFVRRVLGKIARFGGIFETLVNCAWVLWKGRWIDEDLPTKVERDQKTIVGTVAHGAGFYAAQRFAKKHSLPLVVFFQDWWPDMAGVPKPFVKLLDKHFWALAKSCSLGICVCEGMKSALGGGGNLQVLLPIPAETSQPLKMVPSKKTDSKFKILYSGNLDLYGGMLLQALRVFKNHPAIELQVRGSNPNWPEDAKKEMRDAGLWFEFVPRDELNAWLQSADAFLVPMVFDEKYRRRMETSFPSKLIEFGQLGKPLIVWGPDYSSAISWARLKESFVCVTDPKPECLINNLERSLETNAFLNRMDVAEIRDSDQEFNFDKIQGRFLEVLQFGKKLGTPI